jgi:hypothetical protein
LIPLTCIHRRIDIPDPLLKELGADITQRFERGIICERAFSPKVDPHHELRSVLEREPVQAVIGVRSAKAFKFA